MEDDFQLRTKAMYDQQCTAIENSVIDISSQFGINLRSALNQSRYFHVIEGLPGDAMHDVLEGLLQYEVKELLKYAIYEQQFFTLENLNCWIKNFDYGYPDVSNKPCVISSATLNSNTNSLKQKGKIALLVASFVQHALSRDTVLALKSLLVTLTQDTFVIIALSPWCTLLVLIL